MRTNRGIMIFIGIVLLIGCSRKITLANINYPSIKFFNRSINQLKRSNKIFIQNVSNTLNSEIEEETYFFKRKIEIRNKIIDSLHLLDKNRIMIIDSRKDSNGERIESAYFFYEDKTISASFIKRDSIVRNEVFVKYIPEIKEITKQNLMRNFFDINQIHEVFDFNKIPATFEGGSNNTSYWVTIIRDKKISYYSVSGFVNYKIIKYY